MDPAMPCSLTSRLNEQEDMAEHLGSLRAGAVEDVARLIQAEDRLFSNA